MNICIICYPTTGGSGVIATELAKSLADRDHTVHLVSSRKPVRLDEETESLRFHGISAPSYDLFPEASYGMAASCAVGDVLRNYPVDVLHSHYAFPHALSAYLARDLFDAPEVPIMSTLHGTDIYFGEQHACHFEIVRASLERSNRITTVSRFLRDETCRIYDMEPEALEVIPNFVDTDRFHPDRGDQSLREQLPDDVPLLMHASNFRPIKNPEDPAHILRFVLEAGQEAHLVMVGDGPERDRVESLVSEFHMREHVTFLGERRDMEHVLPLADALLITSEKESFGLVALEAMAGGVPVLNSSEGGVRELVREGKEGHHADPGDRFGLAEKATDLLANPEKRSEMGTSGRKRADKKYNQTRVVNQYEQAYQAMVEGG